MIGAWLPIEPIPEWASFAVLAFGAGLITYVLAYLLADWLRNK